ncbi:MAG: SDR family oxidoreductase, partial [Stackebrandtia sp.]
IILVGSVAGLIPSEGNFYGATKWAVTGLAENTRRHVTRDGIGVTLVAPGVTVSNFWDGLGGLPDVPSISSEQLAESIVWAIDQPEGVDVNTVTMRPVGMAS